MNRICTILVTAAVALASAAQQAPPPGDAAQAKQPPRRREVTAEGRQKVENAVPAQAPARPRKPRKLLVIDYGGYHPSVPYANLAVELMGARTGAYQTVISHDTSLLEADQLKQFDAVYLNNTVGRPEDIFPVESREAFASFIRNGGGLVANHGSSVAASKWPEFTEILGAYGAIHRAADEKVWIRLDDPVHPVNAAFGGRGFEYQDEIFRFRPPSPRSKVHVLFSIDVAKTDMNQGRCTGNCESEDGEYPLSWVRSYGKGRIFYSALGHNDYVFWDPTFLRYFLAGIQFALGDLDGSTEPTVRPSAAAAGAPAARSARGERTPAALDSLLARITAYEHGQSRAALAELTSFVSDSLGSPALLQTTEARLLGFLESKATRAGKMAVARELSTIATEASVPGLAGLMNREDTGEIARYALARIPGPAANDALRKALDTTAGPVRVGIIITLGQRKDPKAVPALRALISAADAGTAQAAISALGNIGNRTALDALAAARNGSTGPLRERIASAWLRCAEGVAAQGQESEALKAYRQLSAPGEPDMVRIAALTGLATLQGREAIPVLAEEIGSKSPAVQAAAIGLLAGIPGRDATGAMVRRLPSLTPGGRARLVTSLGVRGDQLARPAVLQAAGSREPEVQVAALAALGTLGDDSSVALLAEAAASGQGAAQAAARQSLADLRGPKIDAAIVAAIPSSAAKVKAELIMAAGERRSAGAGDALLRVAREQDADLRRSALRALKTVAGPAEVLALLDVVRTSEAGDRRDAAQALGAALKKSQPAQIGSVISAYKTTAAVQARLSLLDALGQAGHAEALPVLRDALNDPGPEIVRGAILALTDWPDPVPSPDLLGVARSGPDPALRTLALRGYLKLLALPAPRSNADTTRLLADATRLAREPAEKRMLLSLLAAHPCEEALKVAEGLLQDQAVATEAKASIERISTVLKRR